MIHLFLWAVLVVESLAINPTVESLLQQSTLLGCGTCAICSTCYSNCGPGNIGFDQDNVLTSFCTQSTSSTQFWGCLCTQAPVSSLVSSASASLLNCPSNYPNSTLSSVLIEFSTICVALGFTPPNFSMALETSSTLSSTSSSAILHSTSSSTTLPSTSSSEILGGTPVTVVEQHHGSGLSTGAVGGIVGGILGILLLISVAITFYLLRRRNRASPPSLPNPPIAAAVEKTNDSIQAENLERDQSEDIILGGRLRYPNDEAVGGRLRYPDDRVTEGGRLGSPI